MSVGAGSGRVGRSTWYIELRGVGNVVRGMQKVSKSTESLASITQAFFAAYTGNRIAQIAAGWAKYAARVEMLGPVYQLVGKNAGYTTSELLRQEGILKKLGITTEHTRQVTTRLMQAQLGLGNAARLARISQDAAVIAGVDSSETYQMMTRAIQMMYPRLLRTVGITITATRAYQEYADQLGKSQAKLTVAERQQALMNAVFKEGAKIQGSYVESMKYTGKQMLSAVRYTAEMRNIMGQKFLPVLREVVFAYRDFYEMFTDEKNAKLRTWTASIVAMTATTAGVMAFASAVKLLGLAFGALFIAKGALTPFGAIATAIALTAGAAALAWTKYNSEIEEAATGRSREQWLKATKSTTVLMNEEIIAVRGLNEEYEKLLTRVGVLEHPMDDIVSHMKLIRASLPHLKNEINEAFGTGGMDGARKVIELTNKELKRQENITKDVVSVLDVMIKAYVQANTRIGRLETSARLRNIEATRSFESLSGRMKTIGARAEEAGRGYYVLSNAMKELSSTADALYEIRERLAWLNKEEVKDTAKIRQAQHDINRLVAVGSKYAGQLSEAYDKLVAKGDDLTESERASLPILEEANRLYKQYLTDIDHFIDVSIVAASSGDGLASVFKRIGIEIQKNEHLFQQAAESLAKLNKEFKKALGIEQVTETYEKYKNALNLTAAAEKKLQKLKSAINKVRAESQKLKAAGKEIPLEKQADLENWSQELKETKRLLQEQKEVRQRAPGIIGQELENAREMLFGGPGAKSRTGMQASLKQLRGMLHGLSEFRAEQITGEKKGSEVLAEQFKGISDSVLQVIQKEDFSKAWELLYKKLLMPRGLEYQTEAGKSIITRILEQWAAYIGKKQQHYEVLKNINAERLREVEITKRLSEEIRDSVQRELEEAQRKYESLTQFIRDESLTLLGQDRPAVAERERMYDRYIQVLREYTNTVDDVRRVVNMYERAEANANKTAREKLQTLQYQRREERYEYREAVRRLNLRLHESRHLGSRRERDQAQAELYAEYGRVTRDYRQRRRDLQNRIKDQQEAIRRQKQLTESIKAEADLLEKKYGREGRQNSKKHIENLTLELKKQTLITEQLEQQYKYYKGIDDVLTGWIKNLERLFGLKPEEEALLKKAAEAAGVEKDGDKKGKDEKGKDEKEKRAPVRPAGGHAGLVGARGRPAGFNRWPVVRKRAWAASQKKAAATERANRRAAPVSDIESRRERITDLAVNRILGRSDWKHTGIGSDKFASLPAVLQEKYKHLAKRKTDAQLLEERGRKKHAADTAEKRRRLERRMAGDGRPAPAEKKPPVKAPVAKKKPRQVGWAPKVAQKLPPREKWWTPFRPFVPGTPEDIAWMKTQQSRPRGGWSGEESQSDLYDPTGAVEKFGKRGLRNKDRRGPSGVRASQPGETQADLVPKKKPPFDLPPKDKWWTPFRPFAPGTPEDDAWLKYQHSKPKGDWYEAPPPEKKKSDSLRMIEKGTAESLLRAEKRRGSLSDLEKSVPKELLDEFLRRRKDKMEEWEAGLHDIPGVQKGDWVGAQEYFSKEEMSLLKRGGRAQDRDKTKLFEEDVPAYKPYERPPLPPGAVNLGQDAAQQAAATQASTRDMMGQVNQGKQQMKALQDADEQRTDVVKGAVGLFTDAVGTLVSGVETFTEEIESEMERFKKTVGRQIEAAFRAINAGSQ